ncbi:MAG: hypothetical protein IJE09_04390, partial [Oscillospiraceae bacterium]|nr:hypothetical protein [Oscillospiraceae bacterium]
YKSWLGVTPSVKTKGDDRSSSLTPVGGVQGKHPLTSFFGDTKPRFFSRGKKWGFDILHTQPKVVLAPALW